MAVAADLRIPGYLDLNGTTKTFASISVRHASPHSIAITINFGSASRALLSDLVHSGP